MNRRNPNWKRFTLLFAIIFCSARPGISQDRLSRLEWFFESGGSFLNLGQQEGEVPISGTVGYLVSPDHFTSSALYFTGFRYHLTARNALEVGYSGSVNNLFKIQPTTAGVPAARSRFEKYSYSFNYVRYLSERGALQPFVTVGLGAIQSSTLVTGWDQTNLAVNFGLGTDFRINERLSFRLEVRDYIGFLPAPLQGTSHDLAPTAGLVFSPRTSGSAPSRFPQVEVFLEGGGSVLTGASGPDGQTGILTSSGRQNVDILGTNSFSKSGRLLGGFRVAFSNNNALELSYSRSPNRYELKRSIPGMPEPPVSLPPRQVTLAVVDYAIDYVRYMPGGRSLKPFVSAGVGAANFGGILEDNDNFGWNVGVGADAPLWKRLAIRVELRDYMSKQPAPAAGLVHNIAPTAGLAYRFN